MTGSSSFKNAVDRRFAALPQKTAGYATLAGAIAGMALYAAFGPNDIVTALIVGAVLGGIAGQLLIRIALAAIEAAATRRMELAVVVAGIALVLAIWYMAR